MAAKKPHRHTSEVLNEIIEKCSQGTISLGDFVRILGDRAFGLVILVFSLPNSLPIPGIPGFSTITGLPITFFAMQMLLGQKVLWLPKKLAKREFSGPSMTKVLRKALPVVMWIEKFLKPRLFFVSSPAGERLLGLFMVVLSLIIALPIPLGNFLPGVSMSVLAIGLVERDGIFLLGGMVVSIATVLFMSTVITLFFKGVVAAIGLI